jgi:hypothetical protein
VQVLVGHGAQQLVALHRAPRRRDAGGGWGNPNVGRRWRPTDREHAG